MRTRVKICGITRREDVGLAVTAGADAIGLVFYHPSPRAITIARARALLVDLPPFITVVGLFVNEQRTKIAEVIASVRIDLLQFHGDEQPEDCSGYGRPWIKAIPMRDDINIAAMRTHYQEAVTLLLDTYKPGIPGGTGGSFDWRLIHPHWRDKIILAGGLTPDTVEQAVRQVRPYAVDVSSGVESASGIKDAAKVMAFMRGVRAAECEDYH